jgi:hypothetical protein
VRNPTSRLVTDDMREASRVIGQLRAGIHEVIRTTTDSETRDYLTKLVGDA